MAGTAKPLAVPSPIAFCCYFALVASIVLMQLAVKKYRLLPTVLAASFGMQIMAVVGLPIVVLIIRWRNSKKPQAEEKPFQRDEINLNWLPRPMTVAAWLGVGTFVWFVRSTFDQPELWRLAIAVQGFSYLPLLWKVLTTRSVANISAKKLVLDAIWLTCRLIATNTLDMKLPRKSGAPFIMAVDALSLTAVGALLFSTFGWRKGTYQASADSFPWWSFLVLLPLAAILRITMGNSFVPDFLWTLALYTDVLSMMPQLWLIAQTGGVVEETVAHHISMAFLSRILGANFWWQIKGHWLQGQKFVGWWLLVTYLVHLILLFPFVNYYLKAFVTRGILSRAPIVCADF